MAVLCVPNTGSACGAVGPVFARLLPAVDGVFRRHVNDSSDGSVGQCGS
jgi:hypothetical protein